MDKRGRNAADGKKIRTGCMEYFVEQAVLDGGVKIVFAHIEGFDNTVDPAGWADERARRVQALRDAYRDLDVKADSILEGFNILHDNFGVKRRKNLPASVNLAKLLAKHGDVPRVNPVVDLYNIVSLESKLALGAHDLARIEGNFTLRLTDGSERFVPLGQDEPKPVAAGEYCYCDDANEVLCRLEVRQVNKTAVGPASTGAAFIVQGNQATSWDYLREWADALGRDVVRLCGGAYRVVEPAVI